MQTHHLSTYKTTIRSNINKVWDALTNPEIVKQYFFGTELETNWKVGSPIYFKGEYEGKPYQDKGIVHEYVPGKRLSFSYLSSWSGKDDLPENYLLVKYEVTANEQGTELTITQSNYDEDRAQHSADNWAAVIDGLKKLVE